MKIIQTSIPDVLIIEPKLFGDERGFFLETYREETFSAVGVDCNFVQDNHSGSKKGVLRGLHYQLKQSQGKLVRVVFGEIFDVAVDIRRNSPTFGQWVGAVLSTENRHQLWIPEGFAHGFYVLSDWAEILYKATDYYAPQWERSILWSDPDLRIEWPLDKQNQPIISSKDAMGNTLKNSEVYAQ
jgi:dTDP-4-dehydrorhamnose 3,5-epimerase